MTTPMRAYLACPRCRRRYQPPAERCPDDGSPLYGPEVLARVGRSFAGYRVEGVLGQGGMAVVYLAEQPDIARKVAIKVMHARLGGRPEAAEQFLAEARAARRVRHPHVCEVTDVGRAEGGIPYYAMELLRGASLEDQLEAAGRLPPARALAVAIQVARALGAVHAAGYIHQDLKPENVFLARGRGPQGPLFGEGAGGAALLRETVKLLDFGLARPIAGAPARGRLLFGTPHYMAPEQCRGLPAGPASDIYALGVLLFEMLSGDVPFDADDPVAVMRAHVEAPPPDLSRRLPAVPPRVAAIVARCLAKSPADRFPTMAAVEDALTRALAALVAPSPAPREARSASAGRRG